MRILLLAQSKSAPGERDRATRSSSRLSRCLRAPICSSTCISVIIAWPFIIVPRLATNLSAQPVAVLFWLATRRARGVAIQQWLFTSRQPWTSFRIRPTTLPSSTCRASISEPASPDSPNPLSHRFHTLCHGDPRTSRQQVNSAICEQIAHVFDHMMPQRYPL